PICSPAQATPRAPCAPTSGRSRSPRTTSSAPSSSGVWPSCAEERAGLSKPGPGCDVLSRPPIRAAPIDKEATVSTTSSSKPDPRRWQALALLCAAFFMVILDSAIVLVALPSIDADLSFSAGDLQWVLSAYLLSFG